MDNLVKEKEAEWNRRIECLTINNNEQLEKLKTKYEDKIHNLKIENEIYKLKEEIKSHKGTNTKINDPTHPEISIESTSKIFGISTLEFLDQFIDKTKCE